MEKSSKNLSIEEWAKKRDYKNAETIIFLTTAFIKENAIDWNSPSGKAKVVSYINDFYFGIDGNDDTYNPDWQKHQPDNNPFELSENEIDSSLPESDTLEHRIQSLDAPIEVKEILKEYEDKAYKSSILSNLNDHGRIKLIRRFKIITSLKNRH